MAVGEAGQGARLDAATQSLRQGLLQHGDDDAQRMRALETIVQRSVVAPTWPNSPDAVRTLTNSDGEHAMPLFSALDTLQAAARRFGWAQPDGSLGLRELPAREALRSALEQGVHFVVLDIFAEHATEFSRDEITQVLLRVPETAGRAHDRRAQAGGAPAARTPAAPTRASVEARPTAARAASAVKPGAAILGEIDLPFASRRAAAKPAPRAATEEAPARSRRERPARRDPRAEPSQPAMPAPAVNRAEVVRAPDTLKEQPAPRAQRTVQATPAAFAPPVQEAPAAFARPPTPAPFARPATPASFERAATPAAFAPPALEPAAAFSPPAIEPLPPATLHADAGPAIGFGFDAQPEPEANPAALQAAAMVAQVAKLAGDADTQQAAAEVAAMLKDMARKGVVEEAKPNAAQSAAKLLAGMLSADAAAGDAKRNKRPESKQALAAAQPPEASAPEAFGVSSREAPLDDALLDAISDLLRKYPEVEWACELEDGTAVPVIGVRIDPSFQTRAGEVRGGIMAVAQKRGVELSVLLLNDAQLVKDARANGSAFFPWRKRAKR
jgi:hypothetical protein